ncbi:BnaC06g04210D [Brassica napus]|uniref:BnaC06g04210D protein n=1 Tax=Brassica napus TaxID=3708 RepID=A0A078GIJ2_BRANA|nr:BnaC06g04210D [Brassica napus]
MRNQIRRRGTRRNPIRRRDTVSEIPDELLLTILSFLPSKDVVATSAISKRWKSLWKEVKTFRYDDSYPLTFNMFALFIRSRSSVDILQLKLNPETPHFIDLVVRRSLYTNVMIFTIDVPTLKNLCIYNSWKSRPEGVHGFVVNAPSLSVNISPYLHLATSFLFLDHLELFSCPSQWCNLLKDAPILRVLKLYQKHSQSNDTCMLVFE